MSIKSFIFSLLFLTAAYSAPVQATVAIGEKAPGFSLSGHDGKTYALSDYEGKAVVLEWYNHECPFVRKHYDSKNMQDLQQRYTGKDVVWFTVISSAEGKQGYFDAAGAAANLAKEAGSPTAVLLDPKGETGNAYGASTTPHMYILNTNHELVYMGAIDSVKSGNPDDIQNATNYVSRALDEMMEGKSVSQPVTTPYGCSIKY